MRGEAPARAPAETEVPLRTLRGPAASTLVDLAASADVAAMVLGARSAPAGRRPAGRTALEVIKALRKPVVLVPPHVAHPDRLRSLLVPLDAVRATDAALPAEHVVRVATDSDVDLIALAWAQDLSGGRARIVRAALAGSAVPVLLVPTAG